MRSTNVPRGEALLEALAEHPPGERDRVIEALLGVEAHALRSTSPAPGSIGYHASGVAPIVRAALEVPLEPDDVLVDLGSGLGKVCLLAHLLTGASARGIDVDPSLVARARTAPLALGLTDVSFTHGDAREADLDDGTVFYLYLPFVGAMLDAVMVRLRAVAGRHAIVVVALGVSLDHLDWLVARPTDAFWLTIYDSRADGVPPRARTARAPSPAARAIMHERALSR